MRTASSPVPLAAPLAPLLLGLGCARPDVVEVKVLDIWDRPIPAATLVVEGVVEHQQADAQGRKSVELPEAVGRIKAGKDGFIHDVAEVPARGEDGRPALVFHLYPDPETVGFYAIGNGEYLKLPDFEAVTQGTEVRAITGLHDIGDVRISPAAAQRFVFSSTLRAERLAQLDLALHRLEFTREGTLPGALGETPVAINLWTATGNEIPFDLVVLPSRDDFLIKPREPLAPGAYAFHTQGALTNKRYEGLDKLPKELRRSWTFEVR